MVIRTDRCVAVVIIVRVSVVLLFLVERLLPRVYGLGPGQLQHHGVVNG